MACAIYLWRAVMDESTCTRSANNVPRRPNVKRCVVLSKAECIRSFQALDAALAARIDAEEKAAKAQAVKPITIKVQ